jgi:hypothetical protein
MAAARARIPVCFPCESLTTAQELPKDSEIQEMVGEKVNIAYLNNEYGILWMSFWNTDGRYVLSDASNETYYEIDADAAKILKEKHNFDPTTAGNPLSFWKKIGGKLVLIVIVVLLIWGNLPSKKKEEAVEPTT